MRLTSMSRSMNPNRALRRLSIGYMLKMSIKKFNREFGETEEQWKDIRLVMVGTASGMVSGVYPADPDDSYADYAKFMTDEFHWSGTKFDLYVHGRYYSMEVSSRDMTRIRESKDMVSAFTDAMARRVQYLVEMDETLYFSDES